MGNREAVATVVDPTALADVVKELLGERDISVNGLATRSLVPQTALQRKLGAEPYKFTLAEVSRIALALGLRTSELIRLAEVRS